MDAATGRRCSALHAAVMKGKRLVCLDIPGRLRLHAGGIAASAGAQGGAFPSAGLSGADRERKKEAGHEGPPEKERTGVAGPPESGVLGRRRVAAAHGCGRYG